MVTSAVQAGCHAADTKSATSWVKTVLLLHLYNARLMSADNAVV